MKTCLIYTLLFSFVLLMTSCDDDNDCTKTITIPQYYVILGQTYNYEITQEVSCDLPDPVTAELIQPSESEGFSYEVQKFEFTPDTGNNTSRLQFEIKLNNTTANAINGVAVFTLKSDNLEFSTTYANTALISCTTINANGSCVFTYDQEESLNLGIVNSMELLDVKYYLTD